MLVQTCLNEATLLESIFRRAVDMKDRIIAVENTKSWQNRSDITPDYAVLKSTKLNYLGAREGAQYKDFELPPPTLRSVEGDSDLGPAP